MVDTSYVPRVGTVECDGREGFGMKRAGEKSMYEWCQFEELLVISIMPMRQRKSYIHTG